MITKKTLSLKTIFRFTGQHLLWLVPWMAIVTAGYYFTHWKFFTFPWLPLSLIGTAVAFYVGFKNNQAYDRLWEARKIWGSIINNSRMLGSMVCHLRAQEQSVSNNMETIRKKIVYRHIAYLYQLRQQLLQPAQWEHASLAWLFGSYNKRRQNQILKLYEQELNLLSQQTYLSIEEKEQLKPYMNQATHLLHQQTEIVQQLFQSGEINIMQQMELQRTINSFL